MIFVPICVHAGQLSKDFAHLEMALGEGPDDKRAWDFIPVFEQDGAFYYTRNLYVKEDWTITITSSLSRPAWDTGLEVDLVAAQSTGCHCTSRPKQRCATVTSTGYSYCGYRV